MNLLIVLILMKLILLNISLGLDQTYIYIKIFVNEQQTYISHKKLWSKLLEIINPNNKEIQKSQVYGFLPDDLSLGCQTGINIYKIILDNTIYAYFGIRVNGKPHNNLIQQPTILPKIAHSITIMDLFGTNNANQIFFLDDKNLLWKYDFIQNQLLYNVQTTAIDYIVGSSLTINNNYFIYLRCKDQDNLQDLIKLIISDHKNNILTSTLISIPTANKFFLRANHLIFLYEYLEPQIYKLINNNNQLLAKKIKIPFNSYEQQLSDRLPFYNLFWDQNKHLHIATIVTNACKLKTYEFSLPEDNGILSIRTNDY